ncbi:MAG: BolA family protein [Comamonas sp.]
MTLTPQDLEQRLHRALAPSALQVIDESAAHAGHGGANAEGRGTHFRVRIAAPAFTGRTRVQQHRLVYDALADCMPQGLHALAIEIIPLTNTDPA